MTRDDILKKAREQRSQSSGVASGASVSPQAVDDIRATARKQRGAGAAPAPTSPAQPVAQAEEGGLDFGGAVRKAAMNALPMGNILSMVGLADTLRGKESTAQDKAAGALEAGVSLGRGMVSGIPATVAGYRDVHKQYKDQQAGDATGGAAEAGDTYRGSDAMRAFEGAVSYAPKTAEGQAILEGVGNVLSPIGDALTATSEFLGDTAYDITGNPVVATTFYAAPDVLLELTGVAKTVKSVRASRLAKQNKEVQAATEVLQDPEMLVASPMGAQWKLDDAGVAIPNTTGKKLVEDGVASGSDAALITNSNKATKNQMSAMTQAFGRRAENDPTGLSPNQIIGSNAAQALNEANKARQAVGKKLDEVVKGEAGAIPVDIKPVMNQFYATLSELNIKPSVDMSTGKAYLDFRGSNLDFSSYKGLQTLLNDGFQMTTYKGKPTLADAHRMKKALDDLLDAKKLEQGGQLGNMERILLNLRSGLNDAAKQVDAYATVNAQYSALREGLAAFDSYRPAGVSWDSPQVANNVGSAMKSAAADTANVNNMLQGLSDLNGAMRGAGAKPFTVDVAGLARYNDYLNGQWTRAVIDSSPKTGMFRGAAKNAQGAAISAMVGNKFGVANNVAGLVQSGLDARIANQAAQRARQQQALVLRVLQN